MNEDEKMVFRLLAFLLGSTLVLFGIFRYEWSRNRQDRKVIDCALNGVACKAWVQENAGKIGLHTAERYCSENCV